MLLSRVADRIYWAARYLERAEDTARLVRVHGEMAADLPAHAPAHWEPLVTVVGSDVRYAETRTAQQQAQLAPLPPLEPMTQTMGSMTQTLGDGMTQTMGSMTQSRNGDTGERDVARFLCADLGHSGSVASAIAAARDNLRTTRDIVPRDAWHALNDLHLYVSSEADRTVDRRLRTRFLTRVIADSRRLDGVLATSMTHDEAYVMWRLGRALERADMTTRVLGVRAAAVLSLPSRTRRDGVEHPIDDHDELQWMGVLRSLSGLQMYQRAVRGPIEGPLVVRFLLDHDRFPRAVRALLRELRMALSELPDPVEPLGAVDDVVAVLRESIGTIHDGAELDRAMDALQVAIAEVDRRITARYLRLGRSSA